MKFDEEKFKTPSFTRREPVESFTRRWPVETHQEPVGNP